MMPSRAELHVTNGASGVAALRDAGVAHDALSWDDVLHDGPVPAASLARFREVRAEWLASAFGVDVSETLARLTARDNRLGKASAGSEVEIVLWFEPDLYDQLQRLDILDRLFDSRALVSEAPTPSYVAEQSASELELAHQIRQPLSDEERAVAAEAWDAVRAPDPTGLAAFAVRGETPLHAAVLRFLDELPGVETGLSRTERATLKALAAGPRTAHEAFVCVQGAEEDWHYLGDASFALILHRLATGPVPLVRMEYPTPPSVGAFGGEFGEFWNQPVSITPAGQNVLARRVDGLTCIRLDRWLGGTHLTAGSVWRWDAGRKNLRAPDAF